MTTSILNSIADTNFLKVKLLLEKLTTENSLNRINQETGTAGFYFRHIAEAQILLGKLFFDSSTNLPYENPLTMRVPNDDGRQYDIEETKMMMQTGFDSLKSIIENTSESDWHTIKHTQPFGDIMLIQGLSRVLNHNAHHCGQIELCFKKPHLH